jgi:hypothetical protein
LNIPVALALALVLALALALTQDVPFTFHVQDLLAGSQDDPILAPVINDGVMTDMYPFQGHPKRSLGTANFEDPAQRAFMIAWMKMWHGLGARVHVVYSAHNMSNVVKTYRAALVKSWEQVTPSRRNEDASTADWKRSTDLTCVCANGQTLGRFE